MRLNMHTLIATTLITIYFLVGFEVLFQLDMRTEGAYGNWMSLSLPRRLTVFMAWPIAALAVPKAWVKQ